MTASRSARMPLVPISTGTSGHPAAGSVTASTASIASHASPRKTNGPRTLVPLRPPRISFSAAPGAAGWYLPRASRATPSRSRTSVAAQCTTCHRRLRVGFTYASPATRRIDGASGPDRIGRLRGLPSPVHWTAHAEGLLTRGLHPEAGSPLAGRWGCFRLDGGQRASPQSKRCAGAISGTRLVLVIGRDVEIATHDGSGSGLHASGTAETDAGPCRVARTIDTPLRHE